jgi:cell division protease FtsH
VRFLAKLEVWQKYGIPAKRGIILAGAPGTGKTIVCKALATEAEGISCLFADSGNLANEGYVTCLYDVAHKINPCIIFIED